MACSRQRRQSGGAPELPPSPPTRPPSPAGDTEPRLPSRGLHCTPGLPAPRAAFLVSFLPASSPKSAKRGGGPCNKSAAAMETRPSARGRIPASPHRWCPARPGQSSRSGLEKTGLRKGSRGSVLPWEAEALDKRSFLGALPGRGEGVSDTHRVGPGWGVLGPALGRSGWGCLFSPGTKQGAGRCGRLAHCLISESSQASLPAGGDPTSMARPSLEQGHGLRCLGLDSVPPRVRSACHCSALCLVPGWASHRPVYSPTARQSPSPRAGSPAGASGPHGGLPGAQREAC